MTTPQEAITAYLSALREEAGSPSTRKISALTAGVVSYTTIAEAFRGARVPTWKTLEPLVRALAGDPDEVYPIWLLCQEPQAEKPKRKQPRKQPRPDAVTDGPWFVVESDVTGGWAISTAVTPVSLQRGVVIADSMRREDAEFCVHMRNKIAAASTPELVRSAPTSQIAIEEDGTLYLRSQTLEGGA